MSISAQHTYGEYLRHWRTIRGMSQLDLASRGDVSQRHISFLETGRSRPSREMVTHLCITLGVPAREHNLMLKAAGFAASHTETPLEAIADVSQVIGTMLEAHMPNPAIVVDRCWNLIRANGAATVLTAALFHEPPAWVTPPLNVMRLALHPDGMRRNTVNWEESSAALLRRLEADASMHPHDAELQGLFDELMQYPEVAGLRGRMPTPGSSDLLVPIIYRLGDEHISFFTTIARIGDAHDLTLSELRIETFWPLDERSRTAWARIAS